MAITTALLSEAEVLSWIRESESGTYSSSRFDNLSMSVGAKSQATQTAGNSGDLPRLPTIGSNAYFLHEDWANMLTLIARIEWMHEQVNKGTLPEHVWMDFAALDVEHFHIELRSAFDYLARIVIAQSSQPRQTPKESFNNLSEWTTKNEARAGQLLGPDLARCVKESSKLFLSRKRIRELVVHSGARSLVFHSTEGILFQVYSEGLQFNLLNDLGDLMHNENVVNFKRYASSTLLQFWALVEAVSVATFSRYALPQVGLGDGVMAYHSGLAVLRRWWKSQRDGS